MNKNNDKVNQKQEQEEEESDSELEDDNYAIIPPNGGWGWLVVACAFYCNVVVDGIQLTFGVFLKSISETFKAEYAEVALAGSLMFGVHLLMGPVCAGFSNEFGLRPVTITGSLICSFGVGITYFANCSWYLYMTYGVVGGMGLGLVYMNSLVITSVYFTTLMPIAIAIVVCGTGVGTMVFAALGNSLLEVTTWQNSFLMQAALAGSMGIAAISFRPLKPVKVKISTQEAGPSSRSEKPSKGAIYIKKDIVDRGRTGRQSVSSVRSLQSVVWSGLLEQTVVTEIEQKNRRNIECSKCCRRKPKSKSKILILSEWKEDPMRGRRKSYVPQESQEKIPSASDAVDRLEKERSSDTYKTVFTRVDVPKKPQNQRCQRLKRTITAMLDCHLLGSLSFSLFTISGALQMAALLVVFIYEKDRCSDLGFSDELSVYFVISLGGSNMFWRLFLGGIAIIPKINYRPLAVSGIVIGGIATMCSGLSSSIYWQFGFCVFFGLGMASFAVFRLVFLVELVEVELVGNATGINLLFMGIFCIISPPIFGKAMEMTKNYNVIFISTGFLIIASGLMLIGLKRIREKELQKARRI